MFLSLDRNYELLTNQTYGELCIALASSATQLIFIRAHDETLSVAMRIDDPDRSLFKIQS